MKKVQLKLITELMKNSRRSDRELAKAIGTSQPTVTRLRSKLEREGYIKEYSMIPDFRKIGFEIMAAIFVKFQEPLDNEKILQIEKEARKFEEESPTPTILILRGMGLGFDGIVISFHEDYQSYIRLLEMMKRMPFVDVKSTDGFLVNLAEKNQYRDLTFFSLSKYLSKLEKDVEQ